LDWWPLRAPSYSRFALAHQLIWQQPIIDEAAIVLLAILFVLFGLKDILTRKPTAAIR
jgi:hypothetical protein